jgi:hypothetical protein
MGILGPLADWDFWIMAALLFVLFTVARGFGLTAAADRQFSTIFNR